jgi:hypothetical protein
MALPLLLGVEDDPEQLRLMRQELERSYGNDYQVVCVSTAQAGLRHWRAPRRPAVRWLYFSPTCASAAGRAKLLRASASPASGRKMCSSYQLERSGRR